MDKYRIDDHKAHYHPERISIITKYLNDRTNEEAADNYFRMMPIYAEVSPVGACNHRCTFCSVDYIGYKPLFLDTTAYEKAIVMKGVEYPLLSVMFAGEGEPLLHPQISEFLKINKENNIDSAFTTNAVALNNRIVEDVLAMSSWVKVSCNSGDREEYSKIHRTNEKDFDRVWNNLTQAVLIRDRDGHDCSIGIQTLLLPENKDSIYELAVRAKDTGLDYIVVKPYSQHLFSGNTKHMDIDYKPYLDLQGKLKPLESKDFQVVFRINTINNLITGHGHEYGTCYSTPSLWGYIMANGDVYSCSAYLLDERFRLGNIDGTTFADIWQSQKRKDHSDFILNKLDINECRVNCRMNSINKYLSNIVDHKIEHKNFI